MLRRRVNAAYDPMTRKIDVGDADAGMDRSWWSARTAPPPDFQALDGALDRDVAVVGAGIAGLSTAFHLAEAGVSVAVVEAGVPGCGASGRNTGFVVPALNAAWGPIEIAAKLGPERGPAFAASVAGAGRFLFDLTARLHIDCAAERAGFLQAALWPRQSDDLRARANAWEESGADVEYLDGARVRDRTGAEGYAAAIDFRSGGTIDPLAYTRGLARAAGERGAAIFARSPVIRMARAGDSWLLETPRGQLRARRVVLATNAGFGAAAQAVVPVEVHQIATSPLDATARARILPRGGCVTDMRRDAVAFRLTPEGGLMGGGIAAAKWNADARLAPFFRRRFADLFPGIEIPPVARVWSGRIAATRDFFPRLYGIGPGCVAPVWCNGRGNALATMLGAELARALARDRLDEFPLPLETPVAFPLPALASLAPRLWVPWARLRDRFDSFIARGQKE
jgi:glycine/D-amino acid oxidase-like deaminating enzyme